jgi:hypothetical protein
VEAAGVGPSIPFRFCNLLILQTDESAKTPTKAYPSYNYRTILLAEKQGLQRKIHSTIGRSWASPVSE